MIILHMMITSMILQGYQDPLPRSHDFQLGCMPLISKDLGGYYSHTKPGLRRNVRVGGTTHCTQAVTSGGSASLPPVHQPPVEYISKVGSACSTY